MTKTCTKCKTEKSTERFQKALKYKGRLHSWCKDCKLDSQRKHPETNKAWVAANPERVKAAKDKYLESSAQEVRASKKRWDELNPKAVLAKVRRYQASKLNATPSWLTEDQKREIVTIYETCPKGHEVDHIVPLKGKDVRGLHVPWNLQHLPIKQNRQKSNKLV